MKNHQPKSRRNFLKKGILATGMGLGFGSIFADMKPNEITAPPEFGNGVLLFQGDSITDAGRHKQNPNPNNYHSLGGGYAGIAAGLLMGKSPGSNWKVYNKGISGNKVFQLADRWEEDCLKLKPDVLSILIGVNDLWHTLNGKYDGTVEIYERDYKALLERTRKALPQVKLVIGEPFAVKGGSAIHEKWYPHIDQYRAAARRVSDAFDGSFVPYQQVFDKALKKAPASYWCPDGVHPAPAGNYLMAQAWIKALKKLS